MAKKTSSRMGQVNKRQESPLNMTPNDFPAKRMLEISQIHKKPMFSAIARERKNQNGGTTPIMMFTRVSYLI